MRSLLPLLNPALLGVADGVGSAMEIQGCAGAEVVAAANKSTRAQVGGIKPSAHRRRIRWVKGNLHTRAEVWGEQEATCASLTYKMGAREIRSPEIIFEDSAGRGVIKSEAHRKATRSAIKSPPKEHARADRRKSAPRLLRPARAARETGPGESHRFTPLSLV